MEHAGGVPGSSLSLGRRYANDVSRFEDVNYNSVEPVRPHVLPCPRGCIFEVQQDVRKPGELIENVFN